MRTQNCTTTVWQWEKEDRQQSLQRAVLWNRSSVVWMVQSCCFCTGAPWPCFVESSMCRRELKLWMCFCLLSRKAVLLFLGYEAASSDPQAIIFSEDIKKYPNLFVAYWLTEVLLMPRGVANWVLQNKHEGFSQAVWQEGEVVDSAWFRCWAWGLFTTFFFSLSLPQRTHDCIFKLQEWGMKPATCFLYISE